MEGKYNYPCNYYDLHLWRTSKWMRKQLFLPRTCCSGNPWNAFLRWKLNEVNAGLSLQYGLLFYIWFSILCTDWGAGDWYCLQGFMAKKGASFRHQYWKLSLDEKNNLTKDIESTREEHRKIYCANPKAVQWDVDATFNTMEQEVSASYLVASAEPQTVLDGGQQ